MNADVYILSRLKSEGLTFFRSDGGPDYHLDEASRSRFVHIPVLRLPSDAIDTYLVAQGRGSGRSADGPTDALDMVVLHVVEALTADHGDGLNATTAVGFRYGADGSAEFFVDVERPSSGSGLRELSEWVAERPQRAGG